MDLKNKAKELARMVGQNVAYRLSEFVFNDPIVFENELKYDKLSKDKQK